MGAPGSLFEAGTIKRNDQLSSSDIQRMQDQLQRLTRIPNVPGLMTSWGFFPDQTASGTDSSLQIVLLDDALFPGTYDLPGTASGKLMAAADGGKLSVTSSEVSVVNYSTSIYAPIGGLVLAFPALGFLVAIGSAS